MAGNHSQRLSPNCCLDHNPVTGASPLGGSLLTPSHSPGLLPDLLSIKNDEKLHEEVAKAHPCAFMMGGTEVVQDHKEAAEILMSESAGRPVGWISSRLDFQSAGYESGRLDVRKGLLCGFDLHQENPNHTF